MPTPVTDPDILAQLNAPQRADVPASPRVWGDQEGRAAGLYEQPNQPRPVTDPALLRQLNAQQSRAPVRITVNPVSDRFAEAPTPANAPAMQEGLQNRAAELTRGPEIPPAAQMAVEHANVLGAASQGTTADIAQHQGDLLSTQTLEDDAGNIHFKDPQTGKIVQTVNTKHVAIRDPKDNTVKVYARTEATNENPVVGASRVLSQGLLAGAPTARAAISAAPTALVKASDTFATAKAPYRAFDAIASNTPIAADEAKNLVDRVQGALDAAHYPSEVAKQVHDTVALIGKKGDTALSQLQYVKRAVGNLFKSPDDAVRKAAGVASKEINTIIGETSRNAGQNLRQADAIHSTAMAQQELQRKGAIAGLRTGRAGYGGNAVNSMRQVLSPIVQKAIEGKVTGFKPNEIAAMREIVEGNGLTNTLRQVGAMSPSKGIMQIAAAGATAGSTAAVGGLANKLATILTSQQIDRLNQLVAKRSPAYEQAVKSATDKWEKAQIEFANNPSPNKLAAYVSASRALSSGMTRDGIQITSGQLLKQLTGPIKSAADEEQGPVQGPGGQ